MKKLTLLIIMLFSLCIIQTPVHAGGVDRLTFAGHAGYFAKNLRTGQILSCNQNDVFPTASTSKLVVALAVYKYLYPEAPTEAQANYADSIGRMMRFSDNQSFGDLLDEIDQLSANPLNAVLQDLSLQRTIIHSSEARESYGYSSVTTPYEMATVFESIFKNSYLDSQKSSTLKEELANTIFQDELPRFLPGKVMHKIGQLDDILCDVGIVDDGEDQFPVLSPKPVMLDPRLNSLGFCHCFSLLFVSFLRFLSSSTSYRLGPTGPLTDDGLSLDIWICFKDCNISFATS